MVDVNLSSPIDVRNAGVKALQEALGPVGMVKFMQQYDMGYGDYTKEKGTAGYESGRDRFAIKECRRPLIYSRNVYEDNFIKIAR